MVTYRILAVAPPGRTPGWAAALADDLGIPHLSFPALLKREVARRTVLGRLLSQNLLRGDFLEEPLVGKLVFQAVRARGQEGYVLSGLPLSGDHLARLARRFSFTHAVATLQGLPRRVSRALDPLRGAVATLDLPASAADPDVLRAAGRFLRRR